MWQYLHVPKNWKHAPKYWQCLGNKIFYTWVRASWIEFKIFQLDATYSVYYFTVGSSTCFLCWHPPSGARTTVNTASGIDQLDLLPSAFVAELELKKKFREYNSYYFFFFFWHYKPTWLLVLCTRLFLAFLSSTSWLQFLSFSFCSYYYSSLISSESKNLSLQDFYD